MIFQDKNCVVNFRLFCDIFFNNVKKFYAAIIVASIVCLQILLQLFLSRIESVKL